MWAYKAYNRNAPGPPSSAVLPEDPEPQTRAGRFSFRSLLGRYNEPGGLRREVSRTISPTERTDEQNEGSSRGRSRKVSFSETSRGRSRRSRSSSLFSLASGHSETKSEIMLGEIMTILKEMRNERRGTAGPLDSDEDENGDGDMHDQRYQRRRRRRPSTDEMSSSSGELSGMDPPVSEITPFGSIASKAPSAAKTAAIAAGKEYVKHRLTGKGKGKDPAKAAAEAAVHSLKDSLGADLRNIKPNDIIAELPSLEAFGMQGLHELLEAYKTAPTSTEGKLFLAEDAEVVAHGSPDQVPSGDGHGLTDLLARVAALKAGKKKGPKKAPAGSPNVPDSFHHDAPGRSPQRPATHGNLNVDKHDWDMQRPPQAFDWPSKEDIERSKGITSHTVNNPDIASDERQLPERGPGQSFRAPLVTRSVVNLPSPGGSTQQSDFDSPTDGDESHNVFDIVDIVFPTTPLHEPGKHTKRPSHLEDSAPDGKKSTVSKERPRMHLSNPDPHLETIVSARQNVKQLPRQSFSSGFHTRVLSSLGSCLSILRDLGAGHHKRKDDKHRDTYEETMLYRLGSWFVKQEAGFERAEDLFKHADPEAMLDLLDALSKLAVLLEHPGLHQGSWDSFLQQQIGTRGLAVKKAFLNMAGGAVLGYLDVTLGLYDERIKNVIRENLEPPGSGSSDPDSCVSWTPLLRGVIREATSKAQSGDVQREALEEAIGLLDILDEPASDIQIVPVVKPSSTNLVERCAVPGSEPGTSALEAMSNHNPPRETRSTHHQTLTRDETAAKHVKNELEWRKGDNSQMRQVVSEAILPNASLGSSRADETREAAQSKTAENLAEYEHRRQEQLMPLLTKAAEHSGIETDTGLVATPPRSTKLNDEQPTALAPADDQKGHSVDPMMLHKRLEEMRAKSNKYRSNGKSSTALSGHVIPVSSENMLKKQDGPAGDATRETESMGLDQVASYFPPTTSSDVEAVKVRPGPVARSVASSTIHTPIKPSPLKKAISPLGSPPSVESEPEWNPGQAKKIKGATTEMQLQRSSDAAGSYSVEAPPISKLSPPQMETPAVHNPDTGGIQTSDPYALLRPTQSEPSSIVVDQDSKSESSLSFESPALSVEPESEEPTKVLPTETENKVAEAIADAKSGTIGDAVQANQILTSADVLAGRYGALKPEEADVGRETTEIEDSDELISQTQAEKDFEREEVEEEDLDALVPAPKVITSKEVRDHRYNYQNFPRTLRSAVPRVETHPGAITSATTGEIVPFADEKIHLAAGETLVDGTGRLWNQEGLVEPGKDESVKFIVFDVDIAQIKREYGRVPAILPWESFEPDTSVESPSASFQTGDDWSGSELSMDVSGISTPAGPRPALRASRSEEDNMIDRQLQLNPAEDRLTLIEEDEDDDHPLDDIELKEAEEAEEKATPQPTPGPGGLTSGTQTPY